MYKILPRQTYVKEPLRNKMDPGTDIYNYGYSRDYIAWQVFFDLGTLAIIFRDRSFLTWLLALRYVHISGLNF